MYNALGGSNLSNHIKSSNLIVSSKGPKSILEYQKLMFQDSEWL